VWFRIRIGRRVELVELESTTPGIRSVWVLQMRLRALGLLPLDAPIHGRDNAPTRAALRRFQRRAGIPPTGDPHCPRTRIELREQLRAAERAGAVPEGVP
jgi:peptidoglycan hydrolase-like protein with peptidoglycan-binding domain